MMLVNKKMDLKKIRRDIKKLGFNYRKISGSQFDYLEFFHIATKKEFPSCFTEDSLIFFSELIEYFKKKVIL